jgi:hypothetical protein
VLYPPVFDADGQMLPLARERLIERFMLPASAMWPDIDQWTGFAIIGSGACYNWDENGDLDVQVWVDTDSAAALGHDPATILGDVRRFIVRNLLGITCEQLGLLTPEVDGSMEVQWFAKAGRGTPQDNLDGQPYACYDLDAGKWLVEPFPLTPAMYGNLFLLVEPRAQEIAADADILLAAHARARADVAYWGPLVDLDATFVERANLARSGLVSAKADVKALLDQLVNARKDAYAAEGQGIHDERDAQWKLLEVWDVLSRLKAAVK